MVHGKRGTLGNRRGHGIMLEIPGGLGEGKRNGDKREFMEHRGLTVWISRLALVCFKAHFRTETEHGWEFTLIFLESH